jgi:murein DD-endopeptidase MepM/ murein hydrolase activator NlpD
MKKKANRRISVLFIPDDHAEPYSFRVGSFMVKVVVVVAVLLALHMIGGAISYWQLIKTQRLSSELRRDNKRLLEDNKRVYQLAGQLEEMVKEQEKIRSLLGVESSDGTGGGGLSFKTGSLPVDYEAEPAVEVPSPEVLPSKTMALAGSFLSQKRITGRTLLRNMPTLLPVEGFVTNEFSRNNWQPFNEHTGIDIAAKRGTVVSASGDGQVVFANWTVDLGNLIIIYHGNDIFTYYGHNDRLLVKEKSFVKKGEPISLLGSSGKSSGPHLHFEIWTGGAPVDPKKYLMAFQATSE